jgi:hypothetical protein
MIFDLWRLNRKEKSNQGSANRKERANPGSLNWKVKAALVFPQKLESECGAFAVCFPLPW